MTQAAENLRRLSFVFGESGWRGGLTRLVAGVSPRLRERFVASPWFYRFASQRTEALIAGNERFRGRHRGEIAYVAATGPSLAEQDLSALGGNLVISVNENYAYLRSRGVKVHYNVLQHTSYFTDLKTYAPMWRDFPAAIREQGIVPVLPSYAAALIAKDERWEGIDPAWFYEVGDFLAVIGAGQAGVPDFTRPVPGLYTVSHVAVAWALFLGCREVRVLGVDLDFANNQSEPLRHCYGSSPYADHEELSTTELFIKTSQILPAEIVRHVERQKRAYSKLGEAARSSGQMVVDCGLRQQAGDLPKQPLQRIASPA